jgi:hypothetical protein
MSAGDTTLTIIGNLTADVELRCTAVPRELAITEASVRSNPRVEGSS